MSLDLCPCFNLTAFRLSSNVSRDWHLHCPLDKSPHLISPSSTLGCGKSTSGLTLALVILQNSLSRSPRCHIRSHGPSPTARDLEPLPHAIAGRQHISSKVTKNR